MHHHPQQLTVPCKTIGALDLTDATHTKLEKTRFTCMFEEGGNLVDTSHHFLSRRALVQTRVDPLIFFDK